MRITGSERLTREIERYKAAAADLEREVAKGNIIAALATEARTGIEKRTRKGLDVMDRPFAPYSPRHAEKRREAGLQTSRVDLSFSGAMLRILSQRILSGTTAEIFEPAFPGPDDRTPRDVVARGHQFGNAAVKLPQRWWLGLGRAITARLQEMGATMLARAIRDTFIQGRRAAVGGAGRAAASRS